MVDGASFIGGAFQGDARHEGWGGFVDVVAYPTWPIGVMAHTPGWAGGGWWCVVLLGVVCWCCHWSPLPCPLVCGGAVRGRVKRRMRGDGRGGLRENNHAKPT